MPCNLHRSHCWHNTLLILHNSMFLFSYNTRSLLNQIFYLLPFMPKFHINNWRINKNLRSCGKPLLILHCFRASNYSDIFPDSSDIIPDSSAISLRSSEILTGYGEISSNPVRFWSDLAKFDRIWWDFRRIWRNLIESGEIFIRSMFFPPFSRRPESDLPARHPLMFWTTQPNYSARSAAGAFFLHPIPAGWFWVGHKPDLDWPMDSPSIHALLRPSCHQRDISLDIRLSLSTWALLVSSWSLCSTLKSCFHPFPVWPVFSIMCTHFSTFL